MKKLFTIYILCSTAICSWSQIVFTSPDNALPASQVGVIRYEMIEPICQTYSLTDCILAGGSGSEFAIATTNVGQGLVDVAPDSNPVPTCFEYTAPASYIGLDSVTFTVENELSEVAELTIIFRIIHPGVSAQPQLNLYGVTQSDLIAQDPDPDATYAWEVLNGNAVIADPNAASTTITGLEEGGYLLTWTQTFPCGEVRSAYKVIYVFPGQSYDPDSPIHFTGDSLSRPVSCNQSLPISDISSDCPGPIEVSVIQDTTSTEFCKLTSSLGSNPCSYPYAWSLALFGVPGAERWYVPQTLGYRTYENGTLHIYGKVANAVNSNAVLELDVWLYDAMTWNEWSTQQFSTSYKADCNGVGANHTGWMYYKFGYGVATGLGDLAGSYLNFSQAPANYFFGFQLGSGANNLNSGYGLGGWLNFTGNLQNATSGFSSVVSGAGDIAGNSNCCQTPEVKIQYEVTDACLNSASATQIFDIIDSTGPSLSNEPPTGETLCAADFTPWGASWIDNCSDVSVVDNNTFVGSDYQYLQTATDACGNSSNLNIFQPLFTGDCTTLGCTDAGACNYSPLATVDDGSCYILTVDAGSDVEICLGESVELTSTYDPIYLSDLAYFWTPTESISGNGLQGVVATPDVTTTYVVTVEDPNGCLAFDDVNVTVNDACVPGCMDATAYNFNPLAQTDNGSCTYLSGILIYNDQNGDGVHQLSEPGIPYWPVALDGSQAVLYSNIFGYINMPYPAGDYSFNLINTSSVWTSTTPASIAISLPNTGLAQFGLIASGDAISEAEVYEGFWEVIHCESGFEGGVHILNSGGSTLSGQITLSCDNLFLPAADAFATVAPDVTASGYAEWNIQDFTAGSSSLFSFHVNSPGIEFLGANFDFTLSIVLYNDLNEVVFTDSWTVSPLVTCAYDPNDLKANPVGWYDPHFILPGQQIDYRIRFENLGNAPAEDVVIMDALDASLFDLQTFEPMYASHPVTICLHDDGMVDLIFENINLPGNEENSEQSHGFGMFRINARADLEPETVLTNQATIFFDQNPAVLTNEVFHTIFDCNGFEGIEGITDVCEGEVVELNAEQSYVDFYDWSVDGSDFANNDSIELYDLSPGVHTIEVVTGNPLCNMNHSTTVLVHALPSIMITQVGNTLTAADGIAWQWYMDEEMIPNGNSQTITVMEPATYYVVITGEGDCQVTSETVLVWDVTNTQKAGIRVYPNPLRNVAQLILPAGTFEVVMYDVLGNVVFDKSNCSGRMQIERGDLTSGAYRFIARNEDNEFTTTLIISE